MTMPNHSSASQSVTRLLPLRRFAALAVAGCLLVLSGCGGTESEAATASGTITLDGQPVEAGVITFVPVEGTQSGIARIGQAGKWNAKVSKSKMGLPPGRYKVTIESNDFTASDEGLGDTVVSNVPKKYTSVEETPIELDIKAGANDDLVIALESDGTEE